MANDAQPYGIGSETWPGLAKLVEEMGELQQLLGKVMACSGKDAVYWDGTSLIPKIIEEMGDVRAAMIFFSEENNLSKDQIHDRADTKLTKFRYWHDSSNPKYQLALQALEGGGSTGEPQPAITWKLVEEMGPAQWPIVMENGSPFVAKEGAAYSIYIDLRNHRAVARRQR